jgi:hypothetical protein
MESIESCDEVSKDGTVVREPIGDSWKTQAFILVHPDSPRLDGDALARTSRLTARVDNNAIGDGFQLYLHSFVVNASGEWAVVQQGMNPSSHLARRYHWHSAEVRDFTSNPHAAILGRLRESGNWEGELRHFTKESREVVVSARNQLIVGTDGVERILETRTSPSIRGRKRRCGSRPNCSTLFTTPSWCVAPMGQATGRISHDLLRTVFPQPGRD